MYILRTVDKRDGVTCCPYIGMPVTCQNNYNNSFIVRTVKLSLAVGETNQFRGNFMKINLIN